MPDPIDRLALALLPQVFGPQWGYQITRLSPLLVGRPHPQRRLRKWAGDGVVRAATHTLPLF